MKFTEGIIKKLSKGYYNLTLFNNGKQIYKVTLPSKEAGEIIKKYKQKIKKVK